MTITTTNPAWTEIAEPPRLRPLIDLTNGDQVGAWSVSPTVSIHDVARAVEDWPSYRWIGLDAATVSDVFPPTHPGRPMVLGLPVTAAESEAIAVRRIGPWANVGLTGLGTDTATDAAALDRLRPEVGVIDGGLLAGLPTRAVAGALSSLATLLAAYDVLPVLDTSRSPHLLVDVAIDAGIRVAC